MTHPPTSLLKFQIGPVQDFIAQARSTRDLWSGSYLLSWLMAAGIRKLPEDSLIFPNRKDQPLLQESAIPLKAAGDDLKKLLTPNLPNLFVARVPSDQATEIADAVKQAIKKEWTDIATACWERLSRDDVVSPEMHQRFEVQVDRHLSVTWQITPIADAYSDAFEQNGWHLDSARQLRDFRAWDPSGSDCEKDSLGGIAEALCGGTDFQKRMAGRKNEYTALFKHSDHLGAVTLIKRIWHLAYLGVDSESFPIRSTHAIAARSDKRDDEENTDTLSGDKYLAAIAFDGDSIGKWISGEQLESKDGLERFHSTFSSVLGGFALVEARRIVEATVDGKNQSGKPIKVPLGFLIYSGGDDVVALVPADQMLKVAGEIRDAFRVSTKEIRGKQQTRPDGSAGIAIAHFKAPLQDLISEAQKAEKRAKCDLDEGGYGRSAVAVTLMKRSGEISEWGCNWESGGLELYQVIAVLMDDGQLSSKFPHRVCQLLAPYITTNIGISKLADVAGFPTREIAIREFNFAISRQRTGSLSKENESALIGTLERYLDHIGADPQTLLASLTGLCTTVAFTHRTRPESPASNTPNAERQPVA